MPALPDEIVHIAETHHITSDDALRAGRGPLITVEGARHSMGAVRDVCRRPGRDGRNVDDSIDDVLAELFESADDEHIELAARCCVVDATVGQVETYRAGLERSVDVLIDDDLDTDVEALEHRREYMVTDVGSDQAPFVYVDTDAPELATEDI